MSYKHLDSLFYGLLIDIKYVKITWTDTILAQSKIEKLKIVIYFLNKDMSFNSLSKCLKFSAYLDEGHSEGRVSQILY